MSIASGIISIIDFFKDKIPLQGRIERWKNEKDNLEKERSQLTIFKLDINNAEDRKKAVRIDYINKRIPVLEQLLRNEKA